MSIYVYAADRLSPAMRIVAVFFVLVGAAASAVLITNVHAFEGTPAGFKILNGKITDVDPWAAFFNPSFFITAGHVVLSAFMTGAFIVASVAAYKMIRSRKRKRSIAFTGKPFARTDDRRYFSLLTALNGHESAQMLYEYQPEKLAGAEGLFETRSHAPLAIGGFTDPNEEKVKWAIEIPWALSFLAANRFDTVVKGLNAFPKDEWPPLFIHTLFNAMVGVGMLLILYSIIGVVWRKVLKKDRFPTWLLVIFMTAGPFSIIGIEFGWIFACTGRQPWVIYHLLKTSDVVTTTGSIGVLFLFFTFVYAVLGAAVVYVLLYYFRKHPVDEDLNSAES